MIGISAMASPEWRRREEILQAAQQKARFDTAYGRGLYALIPLGVFLGIPAALGLIPANILALLGALVACMLGRWFLSRAKFTIVPGFEAGLDPASGWFLVLSWSILTLPLLVRTFDLEQVLAVQAVLGPAPLALGPAASAMVWVAFITGLVAAAGWSGSLPSLARPDFVANEAIDSVTRWGESALAGTAVTGTLWGPSVGALARGPFDTRTLLTVLLSFGITCLAVAGVSFSRRYVDRIPQAPAALGAGGVAICVMLVAAFVR